MSQQTANQSDEAWQFSRRLRLPDLNDATAAQAVEQALTEMPGIRDFKLDIPRHELRVRYSATETGYQAIVDCLTGLGLAPQRSRWSRLKTAWYLFTEDNARQNAAAPPPACCNKPPK